MYANHLIVNSPTMASGQNRCKECHMTFNSQRLLTKHKSKFCVGGTGDPDDLMLRRGLRSAGDTPPRIDSPDSRDDYRRYNPNADQQFRSLAENHGKQMEYLQLRNRDLEQQREDIRKRLEDLGKKPVQPERDTTTQLLQELKDQEERNQRSLEDLKRQLYDINSNQRVNVIERPVYMPPPPQPTPAPAPPPPKTPPEPKQKTMVFPVYHGNSLVGEICAIRQAYLANGGTDPVVLSQMSQMQADAQTIEDQMKQQQQEPRNREKPKDNNHAQFNVLEMDNERLKRELMLLQEQNLLAQQRKKSDKEDELERELRRLQRDHLQKMYGLQKDLDNLRTLLMMERNRPQQQPAVQQPQPPVSLKPYVEVDPMAPYDQYPNNYTPSFHHTWNYTQYYRPHAVPTPAPPQNIDFNQPDPPNRFDDDDYETVNK